MVELVEGDRLSWRSDGRARRRRIARVGEFERRMRDMKGCAFEGCQVEGSGERPVFRRNQGDQRGEFGEVGR